MKRVFVRTREALNNVKLVRMWMACAIDPGSLVETDGIHNERISLPMSDGMPQPGLAFDRRSRRMRPAIHVDFAPDVRAAFEDDHDAFLFRELKDLGRIRRTHQARAARTDYEKREALKAYYNLLYSRIEQLDGSVSKQVTARKTANLNRLQQTAVRPTKPLSPET